MRYACFLSMVTHGILAVVLIILASVQWMKQTPLPVVARVEFPRGPVTTAPKGTADKKPKPQEKKPDPPKPEPTPEPPKPTPEPPKPDPPKPDPPKPAPEPPKPAPEPVKSVPKPEVKKTPPKKTEPKPAAAPAVKTKDKPTTKSKKLTPLAVPDAPTDPLSDGLAPMDEGLQPGIAQSVLPTELSAWATNVQRKVERLWTVPVGIAAGSLAEVTFTVARDGSLVGEPVVSKPAADPALGESGIRAIKLASPLPPLPDFFVGARQEVVYVFGADMAGAPPAP